MIAAHEAKKRFVFFSVSVGDIGEQGEEVFNTLAPDSHVRMQDFDFATAISSCPTASRSRPTARPRPR